jgi:hypothetical protein
VDGLEHRLYPFFKALLRCLHRLAIHPGGGALWIGIHRASVHRILSYQPSGRSSRASPKLQDIDQRGVGKGRAAADYAKWGEADAQKG